MDFYEDVFMPETHSMGLTFPTDDVYSANYSAIAIIEKSADCTI